MSGVSEAVTNPSVGNPVKAYLQQAAPVQNTWYDLLNVSERGVLGQVILNRDGNSTAVEVRYTIDGGTPQIFPSNSSQVDAMDTGVASEATHYPLWARYETSLRVEVRTTTAGVTNLFARVVRTVDQ